MIKNRRGFTLVELIAILIVISIIAAFAATHMGSGSDVYEQEASTAVLENHIRFVQLMALKNSATLGITSDGSDYWWFKEDDPGTKQEFPGGKAKTMPDPFTLKFDRYGRPCDQNGVLLSVNMDVPIGTATFTVIQETGYVQ